MVFRGRRPPPDNLPVEEVEYPLEDTGCACCGETPCLTTDADSGSQIDEAEVIYWGTCPECLAETSSVGD
jgi:hypothetical protein